MCRADGFRSTPTIRAIWISDSIDTIYIILTIFNMWRPVSYSDAQWLLSKRLKWGFLWDEAVDLILIKHTYSLPIETCYRSTIMFSRSFYFPSTLRRGLMVLNETRSKCHVPCTDESSRLSHCGTPSSKWLSELRKLWHHNLQSKLLPCCIIL